MYVQVCSPQCVYVCLWWGEPEVAVRGLSLSLSLILLKQGLFAKLGTHTSARLKLARKPLSSMQPPPTHTAPNTEITARSHRAQLFRGG